MVSSVRVDRTIFHHLDQPSKLNVLKNYQMACSLSCLWVPVSFYFSFFLFFFTVFLLLLFFTLPDSCNTKLDGLSHQFITNTDTTEPITILPPTCKISYFTEDMEGAIHQALVSAPDPNACGRACNTSLISSRVAAESQSAAKRYQMS